MRVEALIITVAIAPALGCGFDAAGLGNTDAGDNADESGSSGEEEADTGVDSTGDGDDDTTGDGDGDTTGDGDGDTTGDGDGDTTGDGDGDGDGDTTGDGDGDGDTMDPCEGYQIKLIMLASDGEVAGEMQLGGEPDLYEGIYAQSEVADEGTITWTFDLECPVEVAIWGVVWDADPGPHLQGDPDSFWARVDGEDPEHKWVYGCETGNREPGWSYRRVSHNLGTDSCEVQQLSWNLDAGNHELRLRNREPAPDSYSAAAVARVLVTSDLGYVPDLQTD